ncbi:uncharacterized protein CIMG_04708 [Coccidioides immitis RS]|uniref:Mid2 domain-containing protein n=1 Tax=Coccidioides immitis (strain RS) TaxID=246410 RepID=J3KE22_COCIM|nr:uncharacterized protein CIMG_04708 [Coccidioides immitis RS]EAS33684.3 hypothetical protein CIMG_04708 [Coccidioides immitis RS]
MVSLRLLSTVAPLTLLVIPYSISVSAIEDPTPLQTCFDFTGRPLTNNTQCPGSNACCHYLHQCTGNRLCTQPNSPEYVNALCAVNPWQNCSNICQYGANGDGYLPRVRRCLNGSYCCDSDKNCCDKGNGIFLDSEGNVVQSSTSQPSSPTSTLFSPLSDLPASAASVTSFPSIAPTTTPTSAPKSSTLPLAVNIGIGVAVGFSLLSCGILFAIYLQKRQKNKTNQNNESKGLPPDGEGWPVSNSRSMWPQEMAHSPIPHEFEMPNDSIRVELAGDMPPYPELYGSGLKCDIKKGPPTMI